MRLSVGRLLDEAGLEDVRRDSGLYVALWRGGAHAGRRELAVRPLTPPAPGSHELLVAMNPEGVEVVFGEHGTDRLLLAHDSAVLVRTSSSYRLESRGGDPRLLVVVGTHQDSGASHRGPEPHAVPVGGDEAAGHEGDVAGKERPAEEEQEKGPPEVAEEVDVKANLEAALARIMAAAGPPPATEAMEHDQRRESGRAQEAMEGEEELEIVGVKEAHDLGPQEMGVADRAGPKTGGGGNLQALRQRVVHAGRRPPIRPPPTAGAAGSTPRSAPDPPGHCPRGGPQLEPCPKPPDADA